MLAFKFTQYTGVTFRIAIHGELLLIPDYNVSDCYYMKFLHLTVYFIQINCNTIDVIYI